MRVGKKSFFFILKKKVEIRREHVEVISVENVFIFFIYGSL